MASFGNAAMHAYMTLLTRMLTTVLADRVLTEMLELGTQLTCLNRI